MNNNNKIAINQVEYYNRIHINLNRHWQLKAAWHYLNTPFNNFKYNNNLLLAGVKYYGSYFDLQADAIVGKLTDTSLQQYNLQLGLYPLGNLKLYSFSTGMLRQQAGSAFNFKQVLGCSSVPPSGSKEISQPGGFITSLRMMRCMCIMPSIRIPPRPASPRISC
ncbi:MAG: hypothetical protein IPL46_35660 [Saprospiraceae bacterium]|nr:hypothetical protein [Saprospiraceae bacterium]